MESTIQVTGGRHGEGDTSNQMKSIGMMLVVEKKSTFVDINEADENRKLG